MQYCSSQHGLVSISSHIQNWLLFLLCLCLFILSGVISPLICSSILDPTDLESSSFFVLCFCVSYCFWSWQDTKLGLIKPHKNILPVFPGMQNALFLISILNSFQVVLKVSGPSRLWCNLWKHKWHVPTFSLLPRWLSSKESTCQCRRQVDSIPGSGKSPGGRNGDLLQYSCLGNPMDRGA